MRMGWMGVIVLGLGDVLCGETPASRPAAATAPRVMAAGYRLEPGPYKVGVVEEMLPHDAARDSDLPMKVR